MAAPAGDSFIPKRHAYTPFLYYHPSLGFLFALQDQKTDSSLNDKSLFNLERGDIMGVSSTRRCLARYMVDHYEPDI